MDRRIYFLHSYYFVLSLHGGVLGKDKKPPLTLGVCGKATRIEYMISLKERIPL